jgi:hypothetical protein
MDSLRKSHLTLPLPAALAASNGQVTFTATQKVRVRVAEMCLSDTGTGAGSTEVRLNVNATAITASGDLAIAGAATGKSVSKIISNGSNQYPGGALLNAGDVLTVDLVSVPGTTAPKAGMVILELVQVDA